MGGYGCFMLLSLLCSSIIASSLGETRDTVFADAQEDKASYETSSKVFEYLIKYGYLDVNKTDDLQAVQEAYRSVQKEANIPPTGSLTPETKKIFSLPRCGNQYTNPYTRREGGWDKNEITWGLSHAWYPRTQLSYDQVMEPLRKAASLWKKYLPPPMILREVDTLYQKPDILISFIRENRYEKFTGPGDSYGHAVSPKEVRYRGEINFDMDELWSPFGENSSTLSIYTAAVHQFGHAFGLEHSNHPFSIMTPFMRSRDIKSIPDVDKQSLLNIYTRRVLESNERRMKYNYYYGTTSSTQQPYVWGSDRFTLAPVNEPHINNINYWPRTGDTKETLLTHRPPFTFNDNLYSNDFNGILNDDRESKVSKSLKTHNNYPFQETNVNNNIINDDEFHSSSLYIPNRSESSNEVFTEGRLTMFYMGYGDEIEFKCTPLAN